MTTRNNLTQGPVTSAMVSFALPYMFSYFLQVVYGLSDLLIIGQFCGVDQITAVANGAQVMYMITVIFVALSMGATVTIAKCVGAGDNDAQGRAIGNTLTLFVTLGSVAAVALLLFRRVIVGAIDTPPESVDGTLDYLSVCFAGVPLIVTYNVVASVFRGLGDTRRPLVFVSIACAANIALDFLFIGHMGLGARGAAFGTLIAQGLSAAIACVYMWVRRQGLGMRGRYLIPCRRTVSAIVRVGTPVACQDGFIQLSFMLIMVIANGRGVTDAAAVGIVEKFIGILFIVPSAMLATVSTMSAQALGAGLIERTREVLRKALAFVIAYGALMVVLFQFLPAATVSLFTDDAAVVSAGAGYLRGYVLDCLLAGVHFCFSGFFTASGKSYLSFAHNFVAIVTARLPLAYLASALSPHSLFPMGLATCVGSLISVVICLVFYHKMSKGQTPIGR